MFWDKIKEILKEREANLKSLCEAKGITYSTLAKLRSEGRVPNENQLSKLALALGTDLGFLKGLIAQEDRKAQNVKVKAKEVRVESEPELEITKPELEMPAIVPKAVPITGEVHFEPPLIDPIHNPKHYLPRKGIESRKAIAAFVDNLQGAEAMYIGNALKYLWRFKNKNGIQDLQKAREFIGYAIELAEEQDQND